MFQLDFENLLDTTALFSIYAFDVILILAYVAAISVLFPIFVYINRLNRRNDELVSWDLTRKGVNMASIFPITNHSYEVTLFMQFIIYVFSLTVIANLFTQFKYDKVVIACLVSFVVLFLTIRTVTPVQNTLLLILAVQRFLLYFFPSSERYVVAKQKTFKIILRYLYVGSLSGFLIMMQLGSSESPEVVKYSSIYDKIYLFLDALVLLSSLLYIIILVHVRKITKLTSTMRTRPEKFILLQTIVLLIFKLLGFSISLGFTFIVESIEDKFLMVYYALVAVDILTTPFVIQISYIFCNKTNLEAVFGIQFRKARTWLTLCCGAPPVAQIDDVINIDHSAHSHAVPTS